MACASNVKMLNRSAIEAVKYASGIRFRKRADSLYDLDEDGFWSLQAAGLLERYHDAIVHVPYYRCNSTYPADLKQSAHPLDLLHSLPVLSKDAVKGDPASFTRRPLNPLSATHTTGGTTGAPLRIRAGLYERGWTNAILESRNRNLTGRRNPRTLKLSGFFAPTNDALFARLPGTNIVYASIYSLTDNNRAQISSFLADYQPELFHGYASALVQLARCVDGNIPILRERVAISTSETLTDTDRELIAERLGVSVHNEYGSQEGQHLVLECAQRSLHIHPARGVVEILSFDSDERAGVGELGRVVVTGLLAREMPLFRYDLGDSAISTGYMNECSCGTRWPTIGTVYGRTDDLVRTPDGRRIGLLSHSTLKDLDGILECQIRQWSFSEFTYTLRTASGADRHKIEEHVVRELSHRLRYPAAVSFEYVDEIPRGAAGKGKAMIVDFG